MVSRGRVSDDVSYVLLETPLVPRLDLSDCRPTQLPVLPETTPTQLSDHISLGNGGKSAPASELEPVPMLPRAPVTGVKPQVTDVRTLVVDMRDLTKVNVSGSNRTNDDDSGDDNNADEPMPARAAKRSGGVLKGGGDYVSSGEQRPRPRVSFLLDSAPGQGQEGGSVQIRVYAKPPQVAKPDADVDDHAGVSHSSGQQHAPAPQQRFSSAQPAPQQRFSSAPSVPNGLPPKRSRPHGSADSRHSSSYRQQLRQLQAEARLREAYTSACRSGDGGYRSRRSAHDDPSSSHPPSTPQLPSVAGGSQSGRRLPLFSFKKNSAADTALSSSLPSSQREWRGRRSFLLTHNAHNAGHKRSKGHVRFQEEAGDAAPPGSEVSAELMELHSKHVEPRSTSQGVLGTYSVSEHPPRAASCKPPLPAAAAAPPEPAASAGQTRVTSAGIRSGRVREWLSVDSVPTSACRHRPRPSTVSSASSSTRSRDISSAKQRLAGSSRVSSASVKAASDPGVDLDNMDLVTLNLMARRAKGPSRYRYLAKLRSLNLNTPRPLV